MHRRFLEQSLSKFSRHSLVVGYFVENRLSKRRNSGGRAHSDALAT